MHSSRAATVGLWAGAGGSAQGGRAAGPPPGLATPSWGSVSLRHRSPRVCLSSVTCFQHLALEAPLPVGTQSSRG